MSAPPASKPVVDRVMSVDAYRGFVMFLMMAEVFPLPYLAKRFPENEVCQFLAYHQTHVEWRGCSLHDLIQPSFSFLVGVALPFSLASRRRRGDSAGKSLLHAAWRALVLTFLGVFLRSVGHARTNYTFVDTLSQIGLGYFPLYLVGLGPVKGRWIAVILILVGYWGAFALYPMPGPEFDYSRAGVPADWSHHEAGFGTHWNKNCNAASAFDQWFLNLLPADKPFENNPGGYATLNFIPTLATMLLGLIAGGWLRVETGQWRKVGWMIAAAAVGLSAGYAADRFGVCPSVKRIWTPAWVLFSGGWCFLLLAAFYVVVDVIGLRAWSYPLRVIGANSIAAYVMAHLIGGFIRGSFQTHLGQNVFKSFGEGYEPLFSGAVILAVFWLILWWMYRRRIFVRI